MIKQFDRYVARLMLTPLLATLAVATMLLLIERMLSLFNFVIKEGGPLDVVWRMLANLIPEQLGFGIPLALLLSVLLAFRRLAISSELDALLNAGVSHWRLLRAPFLYALLLGAVSAWLVGFQQPYSRYAYTRLKFELRSGALGASINVGEFNKLGKNTTLRVEQSRDDGRNLSGIFLRSERNSGANLSISARQARFLTTDDPDILLLRLRNGILVLQGKQIGTPSILRFALHDIPIDLPRLEPFRSRSSGDEFTMQELRQRQESQRLPMADRLAATGMFHRRLAQILVMFAIPMLALSLAIPPRRSTSAVGIFLGITLLLVFNEFNKFGQTLVANGQAGPGLAVWLPFGLFAALGCGLFWHLTSHVGGEPLAALSRLPRAVLRFIAPLRRAMHKV